MPSIVSQRRSAFARTLVVACGVALSSPAFAAGATDFKWHGMLDIAFAERTRAYQLNVLERGDNPFDLYRLRLFAESQPNDRLQVIGQFVVADASGLYVDGAYAIFTPSLQRDIHLMAGKLPWAVGTWAPRTYSNRNPLIASPLMYQNHTTLLWYDMPPNADKLLGTAGAGAINVNYFGFPEGRGMPIVDDSYWDVGVTLTGSVRPVEFAVGGASGSPSWGSTERDDNSGKSILGRIGFAPLPGLRAGVSGSYGPYMLQSLNAKLPAGKRVDDYPQKLLMADLEVLVGHLELRSEAARNIWATANVGELSVNSAYAELKYLLDSGVYLAGRWDTERFGKIQSSSGAMLPWDWNATRGDVGVGYRISRDATAKVAWQYTKFDNGVAGWPEHHVSVLAAQLSLGF